MDLGGTRKQFMQVYANADGSDNASDRKTTMAGQMSLFDLVAPEEKKQYRDPFAGLSASFPGKSCLPWKKKCLVSTSAVIHCRNMKA